MNRRVDNLAVVYSDIRLASLWLHIRIVTIIIAVCALVQLISFLVPSAGPITAGSVDSVRDVIELEKKGASLIKNDAVCIVGGSRGGVFVWNANACDEPDGGTIFGRRSHNGRWFRQHVGSIEVRWFGAAGDSKTDDSDAFQKAIDAAAKVNGTVHVSPGAYLIRKTLVMPPYRPGTPSGITIEGEHIGAKLIFDTAGDGLLIHSTNAVPDQGYSISIRNLQFGNANATPAAFINNDGGTNVSVEGCWFMNSSAKYAIKSSGYGLRVERCVFWGFKGTCLLFERNATDSNYSNVCSIVASDMSAINGTGVEIEGAVGLRLVDTVIERCTGRGIYAHPQDFGTDVFDLTIQGCWFEENTGIDVDLESTSNCWCDAAIYNCTFVGSPIINLGTKSSVVVEGLTSNACHIRGAGEASALLINGTNYIKDGEFTWTQISRTGTLVNNRN